jgi:phage terminase large subunit
MDEKKLDRRIRKTKKTLLQALTKLMSEKRINSITVKELFTFTIRIYLIW